MSVDERRERLVRRGADDTAVKQAAVIRHWLGFAADEHDALTPDVKLAEGEVQVSLPLGSLGAFALPEPEAVAVDEKDDDDDDGAHDQRLAKASSPRVPDHAVFDPFAFDSSASDDRFRKRRAGGLYDYRFDVVVPPDDRRLLSATTSYPARTVGFVQSGPWAGTGAMIGPRHMLTASHVIDWRDGSPNWVRFTPAMFAGSAPFGSAFGRRIYYQTQVVDNAGPYNQRRDYAVVVLNWPIGEVTGWLGYRSYNNSWDDGAYWTHIGYPSDIGGLRPTIQDGIELDAVGARERAMRMRHTGDAALGQSGGPYFGYWEDGPYVVAVHTASRDGWILGARNFASGGRLMTSVANRARNEYP